MRNFDKAKVRPKPAVLQPSTGFGYNYEQLLGAAETVEFFSGLDLKTLQRLAQNGTIPFWFVAELNSDVKPEEELA